MSFSDRAAEPAPRSVSGTRCTLGQLLIQLPADESAALQTILDNDAWGHTAIYRMILDEGHHVSKLGVGRHRKRECSCAASPS